MEDLGETVLGELGSGGDELDVGDMFLESCDNAGVDVSIFIVDYCIILVRHLLLFILPNIYPVGSVLSGFVCFALGIEFFYRKRINVCRATQPKPRLSADAEMKVRYVSTYNLISLPLRPWWCMKLALRGVTLLKTLMSISRVQKIVKGVAYLTWPIFTAHPSFPGSD